MSLRSKTFLKIAGILSIVTCVLLLVAGIFIALDLFDISEVYTKWFRDYIRGISSGDITFYKISVIISFALMFTINLVASITYLRAGFTQNVSESHYVSLSVISCIQIFFGSTLLPGLIVLIIVFRNKHIYNATQEVPQEDSLASKVTKLNELRDSGKIDAETYKKQLDRILTEHVTDKDNKWCYFFIKQKLYYIIKMKEVTRMNYNLLECYEKAFDLINVFEKDPFLQNYMLQIIFGKNTKVEFDLDGSFSISIDSPDEYVSLSINENNVHLENIKCNPQKPHDMYITEVMMHNGKLSYAERMLDKDGYVKNSHVTLVKQNGVKCCKTIVSARGKKTTTTITPCNSYKENNILSQFDILKNTYVAKKVIDAFSIAANALNLNSQEFNHKMYALNKLKVFEGYPFAFNRCFDTIVLATTDESTDDLVKLSYSNDGKTIGINASDLVQSIYSLNEHNVQSTFACNNGQYTGKIEYPDGKIETSEIITTRNKQYITNKQNGNEFTPPFEVRDNDTLFAISTYSSIGRNALSNINSTLYTMTISEPYRY